MDREKKAFSLLKSMKVGKIYRQSELQEDWPNSSHDLKALVDSGDLKKVSAGLYYRPQMSKYGSVAPADKELVKSFLKDDDFLLVDVNSYNSLVSGLTQLSMGLKVLNRRRHGQFSLAGFKFDFRVRRDYPSKVTKEFLLVDMLDNVKEVEDGTSLKEKVSSRLSEYNSKNLLRMAKKYGNRSTQNFLKQVLG